MLDKNEPIKVTNRHRGSVSYTVPDLGIRREYTPGQTKEVTMDEIRKLTYRPGGQKLLQKYLVIHNKEAVSELMGNVQPEYYYTDKEVKELLLNGSLAQLQDCLDFANEGVIELLKKYAVELEINDLSKRNAITKKTGFDITGAIAINEATKEEEKEKEQVAPARRAAPITANAEPATPVRRTNPPKYVVTSKG